MICIFNRLVYNIVSNREGNQEKKKKKKLTAARKKKTNAPKDFPENTNEIEQQEYINTDITDDEEENVMESNSPKNIHQNDESTTPLNPIIGIVEEIIQKTGCTHSQVTAMINAMFDKGLAYDDVEAVSSELKNIVSRKITKE